MVDNRVRTTDSYDRVIQKYTGQETIKITKGVCGSRHKHTAGFVYSPKLKARKQYWVGLKAFDQVKNGLTMTDYLQTNAWKHKIHIEVRRWDDDNKEQEIVQEYLLNGGEGFKYVFFNIDKIGHYTVMVKNMETGGCEGGECTEGTSTTTFTRVGKNYQDEISNCWYKKVILSFDIDQDELDKILGDDEPVDVEDIQSQLDRMSGSDDEETISPELILAGGLGLCGILLFINFLKS